MELTNEMILDILENLDDDEIRLFLEHLMLVDEIARNYLYKYHQSSMQQKHIFKENYLERLENIIGKEKALPHVYDSLYELIESSCQRFNKLNDDFYYLLVVECYIMLTNKHPSMDFDDLFVNFEKQNLKLGDENLEKILICLNKIKRHKLQVKLKILTNILKYLSPSALKILISYFIDLYDQEEKDKKIFNNLINEIFIYLQKNYNLAKGISFLEYFANDNFKINNFIVKYYLKSEDYEKALIITNKLPISNLSKEERKTILINKSSIYLNLGSMTMYYKCLQNLVLENHYEYLDILEKELDTNSFTQTLVFIYDNIKLTKKSEYKIFYKYFKKYQVIEMFDTLIPYLTIKEITTNLNEFVVINPKKTQGFYKAFVIYLAKDKSDLLTKYLEEYLNIYDDKNIIKLIKKEKS